jgi:hypothetical protein
MRLILIALLLTSFAYSNTFKYDFSNQSSYVDSLGDYSVEAKPVRGVSLKLKKYFGKLNDGHVQVWGSNFSFTGGMLEPISVAGGLLVNNASITGQAIKLQGKLGLFKGLYSPSFKGALYSYEDSLNIDLSELRSESLKLYDAYLALQFYNNPNVKFGLKYNAFFNNSVFDRGYYGAVLDVEDQYKFNKQELSWGIKYLKSIEKTNINYTPFNVATFADSLDKYAYDYNFNSLEYMFRVKLHYALTIYPTVLYVNADAAINSLVTDGQYSTGFKLPVFRFLNLDVSYNHGDALFYNASRIKEGFFLIKLAFDGGL